MNEMIKEKLTELIKNEDLSKELAVFLNQLDVKDLNWEKLEDLKLIENNTFNEIRAKELLGMKKNRLTINGKLGHGKLTNSKIEGFGYCPKNQEFPKEGGLTFQLNFAELHQQIDVSQTNSELLKSLPKIGILALYGNGEYGCDTEKLYYFADTNQPCYSIEEIKEIYLKGGNSDINIYGRIDLEIKYSEDQTQELLMEFSLEEDVPGIYWKGQNDLSSGNNEFASTMFQKEYSDNDKTQVGGYPSYTQYPRDVEIINLEKDSPKMMLLFQLTVMEGENYSYFTSCYGIYRLFINKENLVNKDFDQVIIGFDCG